tara:strand:- start:3841 stop:4347 length:507 start_codon:yes stop_codon:yes gene_type:complete
MKTIKKLDSQNYEAPYWKTRFLYNFMKKFNIHNIVTPLNNINNYVDNTYNCINNPNMFILIIESLSIAIIMTDSLAYNFGYIRGVMKYNNPSMYNKYKIKFIHITVDWDTSNFNSEKIERFYYTTNRYIIHKTIEEMKHLEEWILKEIDINFLTALSWDPVNKIVDDK